MSSFSFSNVPHSAPERFNAHAISREFVVDAPIEIAWAWLEDTQTFTQGQPWPYYVEFLSVDDQPAGFYEGGINTHHGPFLNFAGMMTEIREQEYRDLQYFYGSFFLSHRIVRPTRLQFWVESRGERQTWVKLQVDSYVANWFESIWNWGQSRFWGFFARDMQRKMRRLAQQSSQ